MGSLLARRIDLRVVVELQPADEAMAVDPGVDRPVAAAQLLAVVRRLDAVDRVGAELRHLPVEPELLERRGRRLAGERVQVEAEDLRRLREIELDPVLAAQRAREERRAEPDDLAVEDLLEIPRPERADADDEVQVPPVAAVREGAVAVERDRLAREVDLPLQCHLLARLLARRAGGRGDRIAADGLVRAAAAAWKRKQEHDQ